MNKIKKESFMKELEDVINDVFIELEKSCTAAITITDVIARGRNFSNNITNSIVDIINRRLERERDNDFKDFSKMKELKKAYPNGKSRKMMVPHATVISNDRLMTVNALNKSMEILNDIHNDIDNWFETFAKDISSVEDIEDIRNRANEKLSFIFSKYTGMKIDEEHLPIYISFMDAKTFINDPEVDKSKITKREYYDIMNKEMHIAINVKNLERGYYYKKKTVHDSNFHGYYTSIDDVKKYLDKYLDANETEMISSENIKKISNMANNALPFISTKSLNEDNFNKCIKDLSKGLISFMTKDDVAYLLSVADERKFTIDNNLENNLKEYFKVA